ncbi:uncharacterized protein LOC143446603 [Clavelina lepadiformis]|uniref:uncharacterized protein LOC143446603 n=1 Tax=Clavelina lepadiformis TaxID=159417 RepID=UPI0040424C59
MRYNIFRIHLKSAVMKAGTEKLQKGLCCLLVLICFVNDVLTTTTISTDPPSNPLATGFNNLTVTAQFPTSTSNTDSCFWFYGGELDSGSGAQFYSGAFGCDFPAPGTYDSITCTVQTIDGTNYTITTLTITQPLVAGNINMEVRCTTATTPGPITRTVQECPTSLSDGVTITSPSQTYQASGKFSCPTGDLFYSNGTALPSSDTTCLTNAEWRGQDNLQCWTAPNATLTGDLNIVENNDITLTCDYNVTVIPSGTSSIFYFDNIGYTLEKEYAFTLHLQREDNMKPISCQAITPYTEIYNNTGRSLNETVNVLYAPDTVVSKVELSQYTIVAKEGYLLRSDENLTMQCIYGEANPPANCSWNFYLLQSNTVSSVSGCSISYDLDQSSLVSCTAGNEAGSRSSNNETITVVPAQRNLEFNVIGSNIASSGGIVTSYHGENVTFFCSVNYSNELNTTYKFKLPNESHKTDQSLDLTLKPPDTGNYSCTSMDSFGNYSASIYVDVLYISTQVTNNIQTSQYVIKASESNYLLRSDQQLTMSCSPSDANPPATCNWQLCSDSRCQTLTSDGGCLISVGLNASSNVACTARNIVGNLSSAKKLVDVIPEKRQVYFNVTGSNVTNNGNSSLTTYLGESIMVSCNILYQNKLNTTHNITLPNNSVIVQSSKQFLAVTRFDMGNFVCKTDDQFGNFTAAIYLNILYAATQDEIPTCNWNLNKTGICFVVFFSNPNSHFLSLNKNGSSVTNFDSTNIDSTGDYGQQNFTFKRTNVTSSDIGRYELTVKSSNSSLFPNSVLYFNIVIEGNGEPPGTPGLSTGAIAGIIAGVVVVILCAAGYGVYRWRRGSQKKKESQSNELHPTESDNHADDDVAGGGATHSNPAFNEDSEKELKINPIYASGGPTYAQVDKKKKSKNDNFSGNGASTSRDQPGAAYAQVDVKKKKKKKGSSEKEEKMNPIYEAGDQPAPIEEAYAEVDKKMKKKKGSNEKEERINPLYGSSESPDQVEAAYAEVDKKKKKNKKGSDEKEERINPLYGSSESPDQVEAAYAEVDKKKKKKNKKGSSEKEEKVNPLYVSSDQPEPTEAAYAEVDKNKKKKQSAKEERINPLYEASSSQDQVEAAYAEVDKSKKKRKLPAQDTTQNEASSNATYAEVNKPKKKKKPPPPSRANTAGGDGSYDDVDLHGSSSTKIDPQK